MTATLLAVMATSCHIETGKTRWSFLVAEIIEIHKSLNRLEEFNGDLSVIVAKLGTKRQASKS